MEQPALLTILRTETIYRFRLELPESSSQAGQEYIIDLTPEIRERLRRTLQSVAQYMQTLAQADVKRQTMKLGVVNDSLLTLGRFLFDQLLPSQIQDALRRLDNALIIETNTPEIPWELLFEGNAKSGRFLCQHLSIGRQVSGREEVRHSVADRATRKVGRRETQGLTVMFLVNPGGDRSLAEEEVATLCTTLPESVSRIILYRQQANQLEMKLRISADLPHVLHYAGPIPLTAGEEPVLALGGSSRLDSAAVEQLFQPLPRRPLVFLSYHEDERHGRNGSGSSAPTQQEREEAMEKLASNLLASGAGAVLAMRCPINTQREREFAVLFYQEVADGETLGEAVRRARASMVQHRPEDTSWMSFVLYGDPNQRLVTISASTKDRNSEPRFETFCDRPLPPIVHSSHALERRFLQEVLGLALMEARRMHKDYLGTPHLLIALTKLDGGCTQDALHSLGFSPKQVRDVIRLALGNGKATSDTPILPTRRCKEILQTAERNALESGSAAIDERAIAQAVLGEGDGVTHELLTKLGINPTQLIELILASNARALLELVPSVSASPAAAPVDLPVGISPEGASKGSNSVLERLGRDLTRQASLKQLTPLIGREKELRLLMQTLMLKDRNNTVLIGDSGGGKTTIVAGRLPCSPRFRMTAAF